MKQIAVISGKGGTGKTSIMASFAYLAEQVVLADCDVDAADLHLICKPEQSKRAEFYSGYEAEIDSSLCTQCGKCHTICQFQAINKPSSSIGKLTYSVNALNCEGCGVCAHFCPTSAITMTEQVCGQTFVSDSNYGAMVHASLNIGAENSGKLVTWVRDRAKLLAETKGVDFLLIDGPPGIGCPVIASITGVDAVVIVVEPTVTGIHDLDRVLELTQKFKVPAFVLINKWDIQKDFTEKIIGRADQKYYTVIGKTNFDPVVTEAMVAGQSVAEYSDKVISKQIKKAWNLLNSQIKEKTK